INVVRRREQADELRREGADAVISTSDESIEERVRDLTGDTGMAYAIDAVGGATGSAVASALSTGGRLLVYGTLAEEPLMIHSRTLMVGQKRIEGFWLSEWARAQNIVTMLRLFRQIGKLFQAGVLTSEVGAVFSLDDIKSAVTQASK